MRRQVELFDIYKETIGKLTGEGILLVAGDPPNPMTIGWATFGNIWNKQVITVLVRPGRHTFSLMETVRDFSLCVLPEKFRKELQLCGSRSGRDIDKINACNFTTERCTIADSFFIAESDIHFECRIIQKHFLDPSTLDQAINRRFYPKQDFHMVYYGEILGVYGVTSDGVTA